MKRGPYKKRPPAPPAHSIAALLAAFKGSPRWRNWAPPTRYRYQRILEDFARANGEIAVEAVTRGAVIQMRDQLAETPGAANNWLKAVRILFGYGVDIEWIASNPAAGVPRLPPVRPDGFADWREDEIDRFLMRHRPGTVAHRALTLMLYTGASRADAVALGWQHVTPDGLRIRYRRQKMARRDGVLIDIPILPELAALLATIPRTQMTFLETRLGTPRSAASLTEDMRRWVREAGMEGLSSHGLRKAMARRLAEAGATPQAIMAVLGHRTASMAMHYSAAYDRARAADAGFDLLGEPSTNILPLRRRKRPATD